MTPTPRTAAGREHRKAVMEMHDRLAGFDGAVGWATAEWVTTGILAIEAQAQAAPPDAHKHEWYYFDLDHNPFPGICMLCGVQAQAAPPDALREALVALLEIIDRDEETWVVEEYQAVVEQARAALAAPAEVLP